MPTTYGKDYRDFDMDFGAHPAHGDIDTIKKTTAISRSIKNIIRTNRFERLFQPTIEGGLNALLFENFGALTSSRIQSAITHAINRFEPRADVKDITVKAEPDENGYYVSIIYVPDNDIKETNLEVYLERT